MLIASDKQARIDDVRNLKPDDNIVIMPMTHYKHVVNSKRGHAPLLKRIRDYYLSSEQNISQSGVKQKHKEILDQHMLESFMKQ